MPRREHMSWTATMSGNENSAVQSWAYPKAAPVTEYVEMPEGSSSAAPVIKPGPRSAKNPRRRAGRKVATERRPRAPFFSRTLGDGRLAPPLPGAAALSQGMALSFQAGHQAVLSWELLVRWRAPGKEEAAPSGRRPSAPGQHPAGPGARVLVRYSRRPSNLSPCSGFAFPFPVMPPERRMSTQARSRRALPRQQGRPASHGMLRTARTNAKPLGPESARPSRNITAHAARGLAVPALSTGGRAL